MAQLSLSASDLKGLDVESLADEACAVSCLCIMPPRRPIALSGMNHRRRCEQHLAVFLDNIAPWPALKALDISTAISHISCSTLQLLVDSLPQLQQLSLPPVATCGGTEADVLSTLRHLPSLYVCELNCSYFSQAPASSLQEDVTGRPVQQQQQQDVGGWQQPQVQLQLHPALQHISTSQAAAQQEPQPSAQLLPVQQLDNPTAQQGAMHPNSHSSGDSQLHKLAHDLAANPFPHSSHLVPSSSTSNNSSGHLATNNTATPAASTAHHSTCSSGSASSGRSHGCTCNCCVPAASTGRSQPWLCLCELTHLQHLQLQHLQPSCVSDAVHAVSGMQGLVSLSIIGLSHASASLLLMPRGGAGSSSVVAAPPAAGAEDQQEQDQWLLAQLQELPHLTRLEIGLEASSSTHTNDSSKVSAGIGLVIPAHTGSTSTPAPGVLDCGWSALRQVQELVLQGVCLDTTLMAATLQCQQLTALHVGGFDLQQDVRAVATCGTGSPEGLPHLQVLHVSQYFNLGPNLAVVLMPELQALQLTHTGGCSPDLSCLEHHKHLHSLDIAVPEGGRWCLHSLQLGHLMHLDTLEAMRLADNASTDDSNGSGGGGGSAGASSSSSSRTGFAKGYRAPSPCSRNSSHWLPSCTGSLSQVTSLELSGPVPDHTLIQLPSQFPGIRRLTVDSSYFASDGGLQKLNCAPHLQLLVLKDCRHITEYGLEVLLMAGSIKVVAVQGCAGIDERACHRIRKASRYSGAQLLWYGPDTKAMTGTSSSSGKPPCHGGSPWRSNKLGHSRSCGSTTSTDMPCSTIKDNVSSGNWHHPGSAFLQRCWKQDQQQLLQQQTSSGGTVGMGHHSGPTSALVAAATTAWLDSCSTATEPVTASGPSSYQSQRVNESLGSWRRTASSSCVRVEGMHSSRGGPWSKTMWGSGGQNLAH